MSMHELIKEKSYEHIVRIVRRHPMTFIPYIMGFFVLLILPIGIYWLLVRTPLAVYFEQPLFYAAMVLLASIYYLSCYLFFYTYFVEFHLDLWIVTNDRVLDVRQTSLFSRTIAEVDLYQIQDATSEVSGVFASLFNYGNIVLQTAGPVPKFVFRNVPHPHQLRQTILALADEDKKYHQPAGVPAAGIANP